MNNYKELKMYKTLVIKKYANRKYYNTETASYTNLVPIQQAIKAGRDVIVIDNVTKRDVTKETLLQSFTVNSNLSYEAMVNIIRNVE